MRPGRYYYDVVGHQMNSSLGLQPVEHEGTMTVDPPYGSEQRYVRVGPTGTTEVTLRYGSEGVYLTRLRLETPAYALVFEPPEPAAVLVLPPTSGRTWEWSAASDDGATTAEATFAIGRAEDAMVGGSRMPAVVVSADFRLTGGVDAHFRQLIWRSTSDGSALVAHEMSDGKAGEVVFRSDARWTLRSASAA